MSPPEAESESEGSSMDPMVRYMNSVIFKLANYLNNYDMPALWHTDLKFLKKELKRLRIGYNTLPGAPSWYLMQACGTTELPAIRKLITKPFYHANEVVDRCAEIKSFSSHHFYTRLKIKTWLTMDMFPPNKHGKSAKYEDKEEDFFTATRLATVSIISKLRELLEEDSNMPMATKAELKSMMRQLAFLQMGCDMVGDVPCSSLRGPDSAWLCQTSKLFYDAENLVDTLVVAAECSEPAANQEGLGTSRDSSNPPLQITHVVEIKKITKRASLHSAHLLIFNKGNPIRVVYKHEQETDLVGIDGPRDELIKMLAEEEGMPQKNMKGVIIVGEKGSGKTTLARVIYHHLKPQFDCVAFVTAAAFSDHGVAGLSEFTQKLESQIFPPGYVGGMAEFLENKRYLVVIDDVCSGSELDDFIFPRFPNNDYGSRVIAICQTYEMCGFSWEFSNKSVYELQPLGHLDSEKLFLKQFGREASCPNAPTEVIKEILRMCGHNPSAIVSIASTLATKVTTAKPWQEVMDSVYSDWKQMARSEYIPDFQDSRYIISLICMHLPRPLNTCLLHLAVHGKNQMIRRTAMVNKWVAEGFIPSCQACHGENLASMCFDALIKRNLIQLVEHGDYLGEEIYEVNYMMQNVLKKLAHDSGFADVFSGHGCIPLRDIQSRRVLAQYSGSEILIHMEPTYAITNICSLTIVGPVKIYFNCDQEDLVVLDMDGSKELDNVAMDRICRMIKLRYLSVKHTQVTEITLEIGKLRCLETLDIRQTKISNLPPEIGTLQKLKILNARQTLISCLPREIGKLQNLETLDVRQTQVEELPTEIVQLPKLAHLYFGQINSLRGVKLPAGSDQLKSVKVFGTVDSREWSGSAMDEISGLTGVRVLEVVLHDQPADKDQNDKLLSSIGKCMNLEYLIINGDYNPSDDLLVCPNFPLLERLKLAGRFLKIPRWLAQHRALKKLDFRVCKLDQDDLKILGGLPSLGTLALALICIPRKKEVAITSRLHSSTCTDLPPLEETCPAVFTSLEIFSFDCRVPWITFEQGAMPMLKHIHFKLYAFPAGKVPSGITNLHSLEKIILQYTSEYASSEGVTKVVAAMKEESCSHRNLICLSVNGYHEEFLPDTRIDEMITGTEIEEDSNHDNLIKTSVNDHLVLDTRVDEIINVTETEEASNDGDRMELPVDGDREVLLSNNRVDETIVGTEIK